MTDLTAIKKNIQAEETQFKSSVSESTMQKIGSSINWVNQNSVHVLGEIKQSMLTVAQFQAEIGTTWVLCDGQSSVGSDYEAVTGKSTVPDLVTNQRFLRQTDLDINIGTTQASDNISHNHGQRTGYADESGNLAPASARTLSGTPSTISNPGIAGTATPTVFIGQRVTTDASGGTESRPVNVWVNFFIKINR